FNPLFTPTEVEKMGLTWLVAAGIVTAFLWQIPIGNYILYPFSILATWFHEMGHGLMALILGGQFQKLEIFGNGSGVAHYTLSNRWGYLGIGLVAAAGPMGPPLAGAGLILASGSLKNTS
ncbi:MAG: M50 family metallopeptidase, partial [Dolichospermum sp.]